MTMTFRLRALGLCLFLASAPGFLSGCGGGGGGSPVAIAPPVAPPPPPTGGTGPTWTAGSFAPASTFKNRCEVVRTGVDAEGRAFPDVAGTLLQEKFWLRSWTQETYLWNREVTDRDPASIASRTAYFDVLKTTALTASGKEKDDFHFSEATAAVLARNLSAPSSTYGARFAALSSTRPRDYRVQYTEPDSPAAQVVGAGPRLVRGSRILSVDGIDLVNGGATQAELDALNRGLFPPVAGQTTTFVVRDPGATADRTVTITSVNLSSKPVNRTRIISTPTGNVGYILFNTFSPFASEREIVDAVTAMGTAGVSDLVLDLRYNGGGLLAVASQLGYMVAGPARTAGRTFEQLRFNTDAGARNPVTGAVNNPIPFYSTGLGFTVADGTPLPSLNLPRVYVLSTARTCSASEATVNGLRGVGVQVVLIGATTCGKPFGFYPQDNCGETFYTIQFQGVNDAGFGDYADGFIPNNSAQSFGVRLPGCAVADDYSKELGDTGEALLAAALQHRATGACPAASASALEQSRSFSDPSADAQSNERLEADAVLPPPEPLFSTNRDMRMPGSSGILPR